MTHMKLATFVAIVGWGFMVSPHHNSIHSDQCLPPRFVNFHIDQLIGRWFQFAYVVVNGKATSFSCEYFIVAREENGTYSGTIVGDSNTTELFSIRELPGPLFFHSNVIFPIYYYTQLFTLVDNHGTTVSIANIFQNGSLWNTFLLVASNRTFIDPSLHESLLHSTGFHIDPNSTIISISQCPLNGTVGDVVNVLI